MARETVARRARNALTCFAIATGAVGLASCERSVDVASPSVRTPLREEAPKVETRPARPPVEAPRPVVAIAAEPTQDERLRAGIVGLWKQYETGVRHLRVRPDGTATMVIDPDWIAKAVIGSRLTVDIEWTIEDGRALFRSVSGRPESAFNTVSTLFGRDRNRPVEEMTPDKFVLLDEEDGDRSVWDRLPADETPPAEVAK